MINTQTYSECCSKLEKIASKRKIFGSDSSLNVFKKQFPDCNYGKISYSSNYSKTSILPQISDVQICPARSTEELTTEEDKAFDGSNVSPWSVKQTDSISNDLECDHQNNTCSCPTRLGDSYYKIMAPFIKNLKIKNKASEKVLNPYTKEKNVLLYESVSRHMQQLQMTICAMNNQFLKLTEKYTKLYQQHVRNGNSNLAPVLYATEDEIKALKAKVDEACDMYKEASLVIEQDQSGAEQLTDVELNHMIDGSLRRDTTSVRLARVFHRIQTLQEKCKTGHFVHG